MTQQILKKKIAVIIPANNEEQALPFVLGDLPKELIQEIIVVNNDSCDATADVARRAGCRVIDESSRGYGQACLSGMAALEDDTDIVVFIDGDYSDSAEQMPRLVEPLIREEADFVLGSRILGTREKGAMPPQAYYGNQLACFLMKLFWNAEYTDLGPFRAITQSSLKRLGMRDKDFGWTIEMQIRALECHLRVKEVPVNYRRRIGQSKISGTLKGTILAGSKILWTVFKFKFLTGHEK